MTSQPPDADDPAARDPFFGELRRRHPDVTVVLLPPEDAAPSPGPTAVPASTAQALADQVWTALASVAGAAGLPLAATHELWWSTGGRGEHRFVVRAAVRDLAGDEPLALMRRLAHGLHDRDGWRDRPLPGGRPRLEAVRPPVRLTAHATPTSVEVRLVSDPVVLDDDALRELRAVTGPPAAPGRHRGDAS